jgi:hypothetical protein
MLSDKIADQRVTAINALISKNVQFQDCLHGAVGNFEYFCQSSKKRENRATEIMAGLSRVPSY